MSEEAINVEADMEAITSALELAGVLGDQAIRNARRLARVVSKHPPRSRKEWEHRAQLTDAAGKDLGWLDTNKARRVDLKDRSGRSDQLLDNLTRRRQEPAGREDPGAVMEVEGQFFLVTQRAGKGAPETVEPISIDRAQELLAEHRPDIGVDSTTETAGFVREERSVMGRVRSAIDQRRHRGESSEETAVYESPAANASAEASSEPVSLPWASGADPVPSDARRQRREPSAAEAFGGAPSTAEVTATQSQASAAASR